MKNCSYGLGTGCVSHKLQKVKGRRAAWHENRLLGEIQGILLLKCRVAPQGGIRGRGWRDLGEEKKSGGGPGGGLDTVVPTQKKLRNTFLHKTKKR